MDSKKLEILMTAIDLGSFTKASEVVGYTQSGLTHMMDALEREVGFSLLQRDHNGIQLSPQGRQLMPAIREFLQANANLENQINAISEQKKEVIRIAAYASIAMHWMPELLYRYKRVCPDVSVDLRMVDNALEPYELLESGHEVVVIDNLCNSNPKSLQRVEQLTGKKVKFYEGDVRDEALLTSIFQENKIDCVIHFAGLEAVGESVARPWE